MNRIVALALCAAWLLPTGAVRAQRAQDPQQNPDQPKPEQPKMYRLKEMFQPGDIGDLSEDFRMTMSVQIRALTEETAPMPMIFAQDMNYSLAVLSVDSKNRPTAERMRFSKLRMTTQQPRKKASVHIASVEGKTVTAKRVGNRTVVTSEGGKLSDIDRKSVAASLGAEADTPYPDYDVLMGEEWTVESPALARSFGSEGSSTVTGKVLEEVRHGGHPCVRVSMHIEGNEWRPAGSLQVSVKMDGELFYALDLKRTLAVTLSGPLTITGEIIEQGIPIGIGGDGFARAHFTSRWTKIAGKPVQP